MVDFSSLFNPSAWGSWSQPNQSMLAPPQGAQGQGGAGGYGTFSPSPAMSSGSSLSGIMQNMRGNPMLANTGAAMMQGRSPVQGMMQNPGGFAQWMAQRHGQPA